MLAKYASLPEKSRGRLVDEGHSAHRSCFQRDRDRIIHSTAFRRLKHKTQVFVEHEGDHFRTRLTHSIEVAQVARTIAGTLGLNGELTETVALAHDLGHTPFGHTGEDALDECMQPYGGFDHNAQAIRIVTALEQHYAEFDGLNLTWETLEGIAKHNGPVRGDIPYALRRVFGVMVEDVLVESAGRLAASGAGSAQDIRDLGRPVVQFSATLWAELKEIRAFLFGHMYRHKTVKKMRVETAQVVRELFAAFMADPARLPADWQATGELAQARKISDYIAGMTDRYALQLHKQL